MGWGERRTESPTLPRSLEDVNVTKFNLRGVPHDPLVLVCFSRIDVSGREGTNSKVGCRSPGFVSARPHGVEQK